MNKVVITGANGFVGRHLLNHLVSKRFGEIYATSLNEDRYPGEGYFFLEVDLTEKEQVDFIINRIKPDFIINTAALSSIPACEENPEEARIINTEAVRYLAEAAETNGARLIQISTDFVFNGKHSVPYNEFDSVSPINVYGRTKADAEKLVTEILPQDSAILRIAVVYGQSLEGQHSNIVELISNKLNYGEEITLVNDQWRTPTYVGDICYAIEQAMKHKATGIYHITGSELFTIHALGVYIAQLLRCDPSLIIATTSNDELRPAYTPLSNEKAKETLGYTTISIEQYLGG